MAHTSAVSILLNIFGVVTIGALLIIAFTQGKAIRKHIFALMLFCVYYLVWAANFFLLTGAITLFVERNVHRHFTWPFSFTLPTTWFFSLEALFVISLAPLVAKFYNYLSARNKEVSTPAKFAYGLLLSAISFSFFTLAAKLAVSNGYCSPIWIVIAYLTFALGELYLSPVGLSAITRYAPQKYVGLFMGAWFLASAYAGYLAGVISKFTSVENAHHGKHLLDLKVVASNYAGVFGKLALILFAFTALAFYLVPITKRLLAGEESQTSNIAPAEITN